MRASIVNSLTYLGVEIDPEKNKIRGQEIDISVENARCRVLVIPTNEELMIAMDTYALVNQG
ncbi:Acetate kinase [bioreactor metagenome]|uniref:Acetate kinase n=2 Tax=root TaxID=1 RepID=A0A645GLX8_9ZZZZ